MLVNLEGLPHYTVTVCVGTAFLALLKESPVVKML